MLGMSHFSVEMATRKIVGLRLFANSDDGETLTFL